MQRTQSAGSTAQNKFTNGDPTSGTPATVIDAAWLNAVQEEIAKAIENSGLTLDGLTTGAQLTQAIQNLARLGGIATANQKQTIANGQAVAANVSGLVFDYTKVASAEILFSVYRQTDTGIEVMESGTIYVWYKPIAATWQISQQSDGDESGVTFSINGSGQVQYTSTTLAVTSTYVGTIRVSGVTTLNT